MNFSFALPQCKGCFLASAQSTKKNKHQGCVVDAPLAWYVLAGWISRGVWRNTISPWIVPWQRGFPSRVALVHPNCFPMWLISKQVQLPNCLCDSVRDKCSNVQNDELFNMSTWCSFVGFWTSHFQNDRRGIISLSFHILQHIRRKLPKRWCGQSGSFEIFSHPPSHPDSLMPPQIVNWEEKKSDFLWKHSNRASETTEVESVWDVGS